jgi:hypothetical protein
MFLLAVEEGMWSTVVGDDLVLDTGAVNASSKAAFASRGMFGSSPAWSARIGAAISDARLAGPAQPSRSPGRP